MPDTPAPAIPQPWTPEVRAEAQLHEQQRQIAALRERVAQLEAGAAADTAAAIAAELIDLAGDPLTALCDPHGGTTGDVVQEVLLNRAEEIAGGRSSALAAAHAQLALKDRALLIWFEGYQHLAGEARRLQAEIAAAETTTEYRLWRRQPDGSTTGLGVTYDLQALAAFLAVPERWLVRHRPVRTWRGEWADLPPEHPDVVAYLAELNEHSEAPEHDGPTS